MVCLGDMYKNGEGAERDYLKAVDRHNRQPRALRSKVFIEWDKIEDIPKTLTDRFNIERYNSRYCYAVLQKG